MTKKKSAKPKKKLTDRQIRERVLSIVMSYDTDVLISLAAHVFAVELLRKVEKLTSKTI